MGHLQYTQAHQHTNQYRHDGLYVVIDRYYRRTQRLLAYHGQDVAEKRTDYYHVGGFKPGRCGQRGVECLPCVAEREWQNKAGGPEKHPLVDGENGVTPNEGVEQRKVEGKRELCKEAEQIAPQVAYLVTDVRMSAASSMAKIGMEVVTMDALMGDVRLNPSV